MKTKLSFFALPVMLLVFFTLGCATVPTSGSVSTDPLTGGTIVPGSSLKSKLTWLQENAKSDNTYIVEVRANERLAPQVLGYGRLRNITIILRGDDKNRLIRLSSNGSLFDIRSNVTLVLESNITLQGRGRNNGPVVRVQNGTLIMNSGVSITGNETANFGGAVYVILNGTFTMNGGTISGNSAREGGGVAVYSESTFVMSGGTISGNSAYALGGGVAVARAAFNKNGGTITGYAGDPDTGNVVRSASGNVLSNMGHAVEAHSFDSTGNITLKQHRETTAGPEANLSYDSSDGTFDGEWDF